MVPVPRTALLAKAFRARAGPVRQSFNRLSRRSYASGHDHGHSQGSDLPWIIGSAVATAAGAWVLWPEPPKYGKGHAHGGHDEHHEEKEEEEAPQEEEPAEEKQEEGKDESGSQESEDQGEEDKDKDSGSEEDSDDSGEEPRKGTKENPVVNEDHSEKNRQVKYEDAKGGIKKRLESKSAIKQGDNASGVHSGQGEHVYNTDTKHSIDAQKEPGISNKSEGDPETAKLKKPVDPNRPQK